MQAARGYFSQLLGQLYLGDTSFVGRGEMQPQHLFVGSVCYILPAITEKISSLDSPPEIEIHVAIQVINPASLSLGEDIQAPGAGEGIPRVHGCKNILKRHLLQFCKILHLRASLVHGF